MKRLLSLILILMVLCVNAQERKTLFDFDWKFLQGEGSEECGKADFDDSKWRTVDLPHDWSIEGVPSADEPSGNDGG